MNNDTDCPLAGRDAKTAAWLAWNRRAAMLLAGNSPVIPGAEQRIADAVELLKQAAPAMLADNSGPDGPLVGRLKSPVIPDGSFSGLFGSARALLDVMYEFGPDQVAIFEYVQNLEDALRNAAAPQEVK